MNLPKIWVLTVNRSIQRFDETAAHLDSLKIPWERFDGFDNQLLRLHPEQTFDLDRAGEKIAPKHVAACLSHYLVLKVQQYQPDDSWIVLEYDARLPENWQERFEQIMKDLPNDWQVCFLGSCCCAGRPTTHIKGEIYEVHYPLCGHGMMFRKSSLPVLLHECQKIWAPLDISLFTNALPKLRTYTVIPSLVTQEGTLLPP